jgi:hypothetical protein
MKIKSLAAAAAIALSSLSASATTATNFYDFAPSISGTPTLLIVDVMDSGSFNDFLSFTLPGSSTSGYTLNTSDTTRRGTVLLASVFQTVNLYSNPDAIVGNSDDRMLSVFSTSANGKSATLATGPLAAGSYYLDVKGVATGSFGGTYSAAINVTAVPEPESYAMLLAGLGLMGAIARRRNKNDAS